MSKRNRMFLYFPHLLSGNRFEDLSVSTFQNYFIPLYLYTYQLSRPLWSGNETILMVSKPNQETDPFIAKPIKSGTVSQSRSAILPLYPLSTQIAKLTSFNNNKNFASVSQIFFKKSQFQRGGENEVE